MPPFPLAGVTPAVFFTPVNFYPTAMPIAMLADPIDPKTGEFLSIERGFDPTDAAVITALRTVRGSGSAVEDVGHRLGDAKLITPQLDAFFREEIRIALDHLVVAKQIRIEKVEVITLDDAAEAQVSFFNVARNASRTVALALGELLGRPAV